jgi:uncharacterized protein YaiL (DUF2058 family)
MNTSLRDQLLAAGLVTEKQAKQAAQQEQQRQFRNRPPKYNPDSRAGGHGGQPGSGHRGGQGGGQNANRGPGPNAGAGTQPRASQPPQPPSASLLAQQAQAAKIARDQELNRKREEKAKRRARIAEIEQIIEQNRAPRLETEDYYSFIDGKKIRRMSVDPQRREQLTSGVLAIVRYKGHYAVVPKAIAERIRERDENMVVPVVQPKEGSPEPDDAYKDFVVPDDLMW